MSNLPTEHEESLSAQRLANEVDRAYKRWLVRRGFASEVNENPFRRNIARQALSARRNKDRGQS